jgi:hypothetical protein
MTESAERTAGDGADAARKLTSTAARPSKPCVFSEVLHIFAKLGVSCFGEPIAHIGYFCEKFVVRRCRLDEHAYVDLVALRPVPARAGIDKYGSRRRQWPCR